jgi:hypothetical protein
MEGLTPDIVVEAIVAVKVSVVAKAAQADTKIDGVSEDEDGDGVTKDGDGVTKGSGDTKVKGVRSRK